MFGWERGVLDIPEPPSPSHTVPCCSCQSETWDLVLSSMRASLLPVPLVSVDVQNADAQGSQEIPPQTTGKVVDQTNRSTQPNRISVFPLKLSSHKKKQLGHRAQRDVLPREV